MYFLYDCVYKILNKKSILYKLKIMSTFKFNFNTKIENIKPHGRKIYLHQQYPGLKKYHVNDQIQWYQAEKIEVLEQVNNLEVTAKHARMFVCGEVNIGHIISSILYIQTENGIENALALAEKEHSDLLPGKYEGGLKIWECTYDLIEYLEKEEINFENLNVLDLGCGIGILGIYALLKGSSVTFQDYNKEIIECVTIYNVLLNIEDDNVQSDISNCEFYCGDWESFNNMLHNHKKYDVILTSETIYNTSNYDKLIKVFTERLTDQGTVYVAAKTHYFGVGGGMREFENAIKQSSTLVSEVVWTKSSGITREILKIKHL